MAGPMRWWGGLTGRLGLARVALAALVTAGLLPLVARCAGEGNGFRDGAGDAGRDAEEADAGRDGAGADDAADLGPFPELDAAPAADTAPDGGRADAAEGPDAVPPPDAWQDGRGAETAPGPDAVPPPDAVPDGIRADAAEGPDTAPDGGGADAVLPPLTVQAGVTINSLPSAMNGSVPYLGPDHPDTAFRLRVPPARFTIDVVVTTTPPSAPGAGVVWMDWDTLSVVLTATPADGSTAAPVDVGDRFLVADGGRAASWQVPEDAPLPEGAVTITVAGRDALGRPVEGGTLTVDVAALAPHLDPFPAPDPWLVTFSRDLFALTLVENADGTFGLEAEHVAGGNGVPDFDEAFLAMGLFSSNAEVTAVVRERLVARIRTVTNHVFGLAPDGSPTPDGVPVRLWFEGDAGAPDPADGAGATYSLIAVGGDGDFWDIENRIVGRAWLDPNNQSREDDGSYGLGVFTTQIVRMVLANPAGWLLLRELSPVVGVPFGLDPDDARLLAPDLDTGSLTPRQRMRYGLLTLAIDTGGLAAASTLAHEMGHSLGLVPPGPPPAGLFSQVPGLPFVASESQGWHIDTPGLNVMQTGSNTNWIEAASQVPRFNELNLAYLRRRLVVDPGLAKSWPGVTRPTTEPACGCGPRTAPREPAVTAPPVARYPVRELSTP